MRGNQCGFAHNEKIWPMSGVCENFSKLGFCKAGGHCDKIHWFGAQGDTSIGPDLLPKGAGQDGDNKLSIARAKVVEKRKAQQLAKSAEKPSRQSFNREMWARDPEEVLIPETRGQFALQEDFIPF